MHFEEMNRSLRPRFLWTVVVAWNALLGGAIYLNGGLGKPNNMAAAVLMTVALLGASASFVALFVSSSFRAFALREGAQLSTFRKEAAFVCLLTGAMGIASLASLFMH